MCSNIRVYKGADIDTLYLFKTVQFEKLMSKSMRLFTSKIPPTPIIELLIGGII